MALEKARVQLLDPNTGAVLAEVDVLTSAPVVAYINDTKTVKDFRGIPAGTSFTEEEERSVQDVLDGILYPYIEPEISYVIDHNSDQFTEDKTIYIERFKEVRPFYITSNIVTGSRTDLTITLKRFNLQDGTVESQDTVVKVEPGSVYTYQQAVEKINFDTKFQIIVSDGKGVVSSALLSYTFIYPIYVGYCDLSEILSEDGVIIDDAKASNYFNTLIRNNSPLIEKRLTPIQNIKGITVSNVLYQNRELHPCIIYPNTWNKIVSITDANEDNITGSFLYNMMVPIKPDATVSSNVQYTVYTNRRSYNVQLAAASAIWYNFIEGKGSLDHIEEGVPSLTGFDVLCKIPVDLRTVVDTHDDLYDIKYKYDGLITFVKEEKTFFKYDQDNNHWDPTNQQIYLSTTGEMPSIENGSWNDITIDIKSGIFYQKYKNIRWEEKGRFTSGGGYIENWDSNKIYEEGVIVYYDSKYWKSLKQTSAEPGSDITSWEETTIGGGIPGPVGPAGDAATIVIVDTLTADYGIPAKVENLGDKQNARLRFTIPRGEPGNAADIDSSLTDPNKAAPAGVVGKELAKKLNLPTIGDSVSYGVPGEILVTKGDGTTEWANFELLVNQVIDKLIEFGER